MWWHWQCIANAQRDKNNIISTVKREVGYIKSDSNGILRYKKYTNGKEKYLGWN